MLPRLIALACLVCAAAPLHAQYVARPWLDWRTTATEHFDIHYPAQYREWTLAMATRIEAARTAVADIVGFAPAGRVQVLVDDPANAPNGFAIPVLDRPTMVFFPVPPTPRQSIGDSRDWGELLAVHEFAHLAHLARPARRFDPWRLLPYPSGPVTRNSPRWVTEGYATYVEGRVTGSGRPHNAQRAALLRQWALEGRLPTYAQMSGSGAYNGGSFAYLVGSAYLEWLAAREGDSTIAHLWRRMTARTSRGFPESFRGVYGRNPEELYGRFLVEVTRAALAVEAAVDSLGGPQAGALVQRLAWETGDPALRPDGARIAVVLRSPTRPGRVVIWNTEPDSIERRALVLRDSARARGLRRDSLDVAARQFFPPAKRVVAELEPRDGRGFDTPRFLPDGKRLLVTRAEPIGGGAFRPDLYLWDPDAGDVRRLTHGAGVRQPDPEPDGAHAVAVQCTRGWCDLVRVRLADGSVQRLREGSPTLSYYRPRVSPGGDRIAVAAQEGGQWRILLVDAREPARVEELLPGDPANRFDAAWADAGSALVVVSDAGGIANLEHVRLASRTVRPITRVTGAAFAPAVDARRGDVWFLSQHAGGLDVHRLDAPLEEVARPAPGASLFPALPAKPPVAVPPLAIATLPAERPYAIGPRDTRWLPGVTRDASALTGHLLLVNGDPVGRLELALLGAFGDASGWRGARGWATIRRWRPAFTLEGFAAGQRVAGKGGTPHPALHASLNGGTVRTTARLDHSAWQAAVSLGASLMQLRGSAARDGDAGRGTGWASAEAAGGRRMLGTGMSGAVRAQGDLGRHGGVRAAHVGATAAATIDLPLVPPLTASVHHVEDLVGDSRTPFERVVVGGAASSLLDPSLLLQRVAMPVLPAGALVGDRATTARAAVALGALTPYFWVGRAHGDASTDAWHRVVGLEARMSVAAIPVVTLPSVNLVLGAGHSLDRPWKGRTTVYASVAYRP